MQQNTNKTIINSKVRDSGGKIIFEDNTLCSQFLRDYIDLPYLKNVRPEDIEDVSEQFVPLFEEERNADRVKRVNIHGENPFFLVSLIEHKTKIDYNVCMQVFRYMVYIWNAYEKEAEKRHKGISKMEGFKYPAILPIVYYEGKDRWSAPLNFKSRINQGELYGNYVPDFQYYLVPLRDYSNEELLARADEISVVMLINKLQSQKDITEFRKISPQRLQDVLQETPGYLVDIIANVLLAFLLEEKVPVPEAEEMVGMVKEKKMARLFENMEKIDVPAERRKSAAERKELEKERQCLEKERQCLEKERRELGEERRELGEGRRELEEERRELGEGRRELEEERRELEKERQGMEEDKLALAEVRRALETEKQQIQNKSHEIENRGIQVLVESCQELMLSKESVITMLMKRYQMEQSDAGRMVEKYWGK